MEESISVSLEEDKRFELSQNLSESVSYISVPKEDPLENQFKKPVEHWNNFTIPMPQNVENSIQVTNIYSVVPEGLNSLSDQDGQSYKLPYKYQYNCKANDRSAFISKVYALLSIQLIWTSVVAGIVVGVPAVK